MLESGSACLSPALRMRRAPPNQVRVPNLIRATGDNAPSRHAICANQIRAFRPPKANSRTWFGLHAARNPPGSRTAEPGLRERQLSA
jgi:hypothetical protein